VADAKSQKKTYRRKAAPVEASTPAAMPIEPATGVVDSVPAPLPMRVSLSDLWEMRLAQADKRTAEAQEEAARMSRLYALAKLDPKGIILGIEKKLDDAKKAAERAENRSLIAKKRMEHALGRSLAGLAIDPDSGDVQTP